MTGSLKAAQQQQISRAKLSNPDSQILIPADDYIAAVRRTLRVIELDPSSSAKAQLHIDAQSWYRAEDAMAVLAQPWSGRTFFHPHPQAKIARYQLQKLLKDYLADRITEAVLLIPRAEWFMQEPLLLSFPFLFHYRQLRMVRFDAANQCLKRCYINGLSATVYLPKKDNGVYFNDEAMHRFAESFSPLGRAILPEDLGASWDQHAVLASSRAHIKPVLYTPTINRHSDKLIDILDDTPEE